MIVRSRWSCALHLILALGAAVAQAESPAQADPSLDAAREVTFTRQDPFVVRPFRSSVAGRWIGDGVAYGPHRDGQRPGGPSPTKAEIRQDLRLMSKRWNLLRLYGAVGPADSVLEVIRVDEFPMKVMLGVWIEPEESRDSTGIVLDRRPEAEASNRAEIEAAIRLAAAYPGIVIAVSVGNETQVPWSSHRVPAPLLVRYIREVRARSSVPITTADDFSFWKTPASQNLALDLDFIATHMHPLWNGQSLEDASDWTAKTYADVQATHPERTIVIGETGWATEKLVTGEQGKLMKAPAGEEEQAVFCTAFAAWTRREQVATFFFEAFDENWKGGIDPGDAEKHWGFYRADRTPKRVLLTQD